MQGRCDEGMEIEKWPLCLCVASVARSVARTASSPRPAATTASARQGGGHGATTTVILMWHEHSLLLKGFLWVHEYFLKLWNFFFFFSCPLTFAYFLRDNFCFTEFVFVFYFCVIVLWKLTASSSSLVQCFGGIGYLQHCQPGLFFNENTHTCDFPFNIPCCQA